MEYFIVENKEKKGPFSVIDLAEMEITKSTLVWKKGLEDWVTADKLEELVEILDSTPPPIPTNHKQLSNDEHNINLKIGLKKRTRSKVNKHQQKKIFEKANIGLAKEIKSNLKLLPLSFLFFIPLHILVGYVLNPKRGEREYFNDRWNTYDFSEYWNLNWGINDLDEIIPRILFTFLILITFRYAFILLKHLYKWFQYYSKD